jgi:hypothetical protein
MLSPATSALGGCRVVAMTTKASADITVTADLLFRREREEAYNPT